MGGTLPAPASFKASGSDGGDGDGADPLVQHFQQLHDGAVPDGAGGHDPAAHPAARLRQVRRSARQPRLCLQCGPDSSCATAECTPLRGLLMCHFAARVSSAISQKQPRNTQNMTQPSQRS